MARGCLPLSLLVSLHLLGDRSLSTSFWISDKRIDLCIAAEFICPGGEGGSISYPTTQYSAHSSWAPMSLS